MLLATKFQSKEVVNVLEHHFFKSTHITVSEDNKNLAMAIVDSNNQIKAQFEFKWEEMSTVSKTFSHPWEILKTPKSIEVRTECVMILHD